MKSVTPLRLTLDTTESVTLESIPLIITTMHLVLASIVCPRVKPLEFGLFPEFVIVAPIEIVI